MDNGSFDRIDKTGIGGDYQQCVEGKVWHTQSLTRIIHKLANIQRNTISNKKLRISHPNYRAWKPETQARKMPVIYLACDSGLNHLGQAIGVW